MSKITLLSVLIFLTILYLRTNCDTEQLRGRGNETVFSKIVQTLSFFCPLGNICQRNLNGAEPIPGKRYCCKECSCADDCGLSKSCCFPANDIYNAVDRSKYKCIFPILRELSAEEKTKYKSFYMIADDPTDKFVGSTNGNEEIATVDNKTKSIRNMSVSCGQQDVKPWGPLFPVFSKSTGAIYKNKHCAHAHGVKDGINWILGLMCEKDTKVLLQLVEDLQKDDMIKTCFSYFYYPGNEEDIEIEQCYHELASVCPNTMFSPPIGSNMTVDSIREACRSGFTSPYFGIRGIYRNVYCSICHNDLFYKEGVCSDFDLLKKPTPTDFTVLLDPDVLKSFVNRNNAIHDGQIVCFQHGNSSVTQRDNETCRELKCPAAQLRRSDGKCYFVMNTFEVSSVNFYIKLTPTSLLELRHLHNAKSKIKHPKSNLNTNVKFYAPKPKIWQANVAIDHLLAEIECIYPRRNLKFVLKEIKIQLTNPWVISTDGATIDLQPELSEFAYFDHRGLQSRDISDSMFLPDGSDFTMTILPFGFDYSDVNSPKWFRLFADLSGNPSNFVVTKLFYCNQIDLKPSEYNLQSSVLILSSNLTKRIHFNGEFTVLANADGEDVARVCLEDSHFLTHTKMNSGMEVCFKRSWFSFQRLPNMTEMIALFTTVLFLIKIDFLYFLLKEGV